MSNQQTPLFYVAILYLVLFYYVGYSLNLKQRATDSNVLSSCYASYPLPSLLSNDFYDISYIDDQTLSLKALPSIAFSIDLCTLLSLFS